MKISYDLVLATIIFIFTLILIKFIVNRLVGYSKNLPWESKRRIIVNSNTFLTFAFLVGAALIWANQIEALALSFAAFAVAGVLATKELLLCFMGAFYKGVSTSYDIGDRIEVNGLRGDVIDRNFLSTKLLEIGPGVQTHQYTGRSIVIPNSVFLQHAVINESYLEDYVLHVFTIPLNIDVKWQVMEELMLKIANEECQQYLETASNYMKKLQKKANLEVPDLKTRVLLKVVSHKRIDMVVRITVPAREKGAIEQTIVKRFWEEKDKLI